MEKKEQQPQVRKPFRKPRLRSYGRIIAITQASHGGRRFDNRGPPGGGSRTGA